MSLQRVSTSVLNKPCCHLHASDLHVSEFNHMILIYKDWIVAVTAVWKYQNGMILIYILLFILYYDKYCRNG